ncbi:MAG: hypothetical protein KDH96_01850 [Candidatus Riesia sp.]|nr:hypothetical protein [Candidatus Riesia sp.]
MPSCPHRAAQIVALLHSCPGAREKWLRLLLGSNIYNPKTWHIVKHYLLIFNEKPHLPENINRKG